MSTNDPMPKNVLYYGSEEACPEQVELHAGPLDMVFEAGDLRWIRVGDHEIVRRIYVAVRDRNWGTVFNRISNLSIRSGPASFDISYDVENREGEIDFRWAGRIAGDQAGTVTFSMRGKAHTTFWKNRVGFCVLHPIRECAGLGCRITRHDGKVEDGQFPLQISPHQPFRDFRGITHRVDADASVELSFEGDIFEMEDQRNWTDASFKTYCTPLDLPYPVRVAAGTVVEQTVRVSLNTVRKKVARGASPETIWFSVAPEERKPLPALGLGLSSEIPRLNPTEIARLKRLNVSHLRVDLDLAGSYRPLLDQAVGESGQLGVPLEAALILPAESSRLKCLLGGLDRLNPPVARWLVFRRGEKCTSSQTVQLVRDCMASITPSTKLVSGTNAYFAELNRERPQPDLLEGICYSINPQVHTFDNDSLVENLAAQRDTVETARQFAGSLPIYVSPVTLRPRFNPNATGPEPEVPPGQLPPQVDVRQMSLFAAAWTVGSLKYLSEAGVAGITYYETCGWRGVMETASGSPLPMRFRSIPGGVFPLFHVLCDAGEFKGGQVLRSESSAPLSIDGLALLKGDRLRVLLANMRRENRVVRLRSGAGLKDTQMRVLDETRVERAMKDPESFRADPPQSVDLTADGLEVTLSSYAFACLDCVYERP